MFDHQTWLIPQLVGLPHREDLLSSYKYAGRCLISLEMHDYRFGHRNESRDL